MRVVHLLPPILGVPLAACPENSAPENDREAALSSPEPPPAFTSAGNAIEDVATALLVPQTITDANRHDIPASARRCPFRFTRVGPTEDALRAADPFRAELVLWLPGADPTSSAMADTRSAVPAPNGPSPVH